MDTYGKTTGPSESENASKDSPEGNEEGYTCFLPGDFPGADELKPGDTVTLKVVGKDKDGDLEVEHMPKGGTKDDNGTLGLMDDLDQSMGNGNN